MNWKLFTSTFILIFLAELGDKTQLTAFMQASTGGRARWVVFAAASLALMLSTLIAVLIGSRLSEYIPEKWIKLVAGVLFVGFGIFILVSALGPARTPTAATPSAPGLLVRSVLSAAASFEEAAQLDYDRLAEESDDPRVASLMSELAQEEREHLARVRAAADADAIDTAHEIPAVALPPDTELIHDVAEGDESPLTHAIQHEEATARFYGELARVSQIPALRKTFSELAKEELRHASRLRALS